MKKKALSYLLCAAMVFSMAACGDNSDGDSSGSPEPTPEVTEQPPAGNGDEDPGDSEEEPGGGDEDPGDAEEPGEEAKTGSAVIKVEAESYEQGEGVGVEGDHLGGLNTSAWAMYNVDLADGGYKQISIRYGADSMGGTVTLWWGDEDFKDFGTELATVDFEGTGSWDMNSTLTFDVPALGSYTGVTNLVVEWKSPEGESDYLMNPDYFELYKIMDASASTKSWNFVDNDFSGSEWAGFRGPDDDTHTHIYVAGGCYVGYVVDFGEGGYNTLELTGDFVGDCAFEIRLGSADGDLLKDVSFTGASDWNDAIIQKNVRVVSLPEAMELTGFQRIYFVFKGGDYNFAALSFPHYGNQEIADSTKLEIVSIDSTKVGNGNEGIENLIDADGTNKYCAEGVDEAEISFSLAAAAKLTGYAFCTGNDNASYNGRNPVEWTLYGVDASGERVEIDHSDRDEIGMEDVNFCWYGRACSADAEYTDYVLSIVHTGSVLQLSGFAVFGE